MQTVLIFGGNGFVGGHLAKTARRLGWAPVVADVGTPCAAGEAAFLPCDITNAGQVAAAFRACRPAAAVNVAAVADIDRAQANPGLAEAVNVAGAANAARAAREIGARYVWFSSDAVFDGAQSSYTEDSPLHPVNWYGETKARGERAVFEADPDAVVPRISLVLGFPVHTGNSFLAGLVQRLRAGEPVPCRRKEIRTPIDVQTLCEAVWELAFGGYRGLLHLGATESINRCELASRLAQKLGLDTGLLVPCDGDDPAKAPRHHNGVLDVCQAEALLQTPMKCLEETLTRAIASREIESGTEEPA